MKKYASVTQKIFSEERKKNRKNCNDIKLLTINMFNQSLILKWKEPLWYLIELLGQIVSSQTNVRANKKSSFSCHPDCSTIWKKRLTVKMNQVGMLTAWKTNNQDKKRSLRKASRANILRINISKGGKLDQETRTDRIRTAKNSCIRGQQFLFILEQKTKTIVRAKLTFSSQTLHKSKSINGKSSYYKDQPFLGSTKSYSEPGNCKLTNKKWWKRAQKPWKAYRNSKNNETKCDTFMSMEKQFFPIY